MTTLKMKLKELEDIEKDVATALQSAGQVCLELSKDKPNAKQVDSNATAFVKTLQNVENSLTKHILYLTQVSTDGGNISSEEEEREQNERQCAQRRKCFRNRREAAIA
ncbi:hypothetical protein HPB47_026245 [Ixodes persulcatus]|uniref:Uncharacterized protein n=1 Tax=Ixodes persulcatus TaxID=34615 RepID=A0AC60Q0G9_IXOPE|nr:hypothetical protein HPB47_026245 [Ixodes persulcatus]